MWITRAQGVVHIGERVEAGRAITGRESIVQFAASCEPLDTPNAQAELSPIDREDMTWSNPRISRPRSDLQRLDTRTKYIGKAFLDKKQHEESISARRNKSSVFSYSLGIFGTGV